MFQGANDLTALSGTIWSPYCGVGPTPGDLLGRWNLDPWLLAALGAGLIAHMACRRREDGAGDAARIAALAVLILAFVSPLCALSSALFSARVVHHALLAAAAAPLLAFSLPRGASPSLGLPLATALHAVAFWAWHAPPAYELALSNDLAYWAMQACILGPAILFWSAVRRATCLGAAAALLATMVQMGLLGALITFADRPLYAPHFSTTQAWGLSPLADQQLAGLIMWAPLALVYLVAGVLNLNRALERLEQPARA